MRSFILLLKIQLLGLFGINKALHAEPRKARRMVALGVLAVVAIVAIAVLYSGGTAMGLVDLGLAEAIPVIAVLVGSIACVITTFLKANGLLFSFKDYDLVLSLPAPLVSIVMSRIISLYAMGAVFGALIMVPAFVAYASAAAPTVAMVACMVGAVLLAPLLPLALAIVLAALIAGVSARFRHANILVVLLSLALVVGVTVGSMALSGQHGNVAALSALSAQLVSSISAFYPPAAWAAAGIVSGDLVSFAGFAALSVLVVLVVLAVLVRSFVPVNELLKSVRPRGTFSFASGEEGSKTKHARLRSPFRALLAKEARMLLATPIYFLNSCTGYVLLIVAAIAAVVAKALGALSFLPPEFSLLTGSFLPWVVAFFVGISSTTAPSVSLEGSARWLMFTAPVPASTVLGAKAALNVAIALPTIVIGGILLVVAFPSDIVSGILLFVAPLSLALFAAFVGLALDARYPRYDWTTVYEPVKRSLPVFAVVFGGMIVVGIGVAVAVYLGAAGSLVFALVVGVASVALYRSTVKRSLAVEP